MKKALVITGRVLLTALNVILIVIIVFNVYTMAARMITGKSYATMFGISSAVVLTDSMAGDKPDSINGNDLVFTVKQSSYEVGDVITFDTGASTTTHRIVEITENGYKTRGDANNADDTESVPSEAVVGKVFMNLRGVGYYIRLMQEPLGMMILLLVAAGIVVVPMLFRKED